MLWLQDALLLALVARCIVMVKVDITLAVLQHFHSGCAILLNPGENSDVEVMQQMAKKFSAKNVQVAVQPFNGSHQLRQRECQRNKPLHVLLSTSHLTKLPTVQAEGLWLVFLEADQDLNEFLQDVHIPVHCEFLVILQNGLHTMLLNEVYRMAPGHPLYCVRFGSWHSKRGLIATPESLVKRRSNFHGYNITATSMDFPPLVAMTKNRVTGGLFGVVWRILQKRLNFQTVYVAPEQKTWGSLFANNTTTGIVAMLDSGKAEVAVFNMLMTSQRLLAMDFTMPLLNTMYHIFIRKPDHVTLGWDTYLAPFSRRLWIALVLLILLVSLFLPALYCLGRRHGVAQNNLRIRDSMFGVFAAFCQQGIEQSCPQLNSCRVVHMTTYLTAVILLASYSATLISSLTASSVTLPFSDLEDVLHAGTHKLGALNTSTMLYHFRNAPSGLYHRVYTSLLHERHNSLVGDIHSGLLRVCDEHYLLIAMDTEVLRHLSRVHCRVTTLPVSYFQSSLSLGLQLNSPYKPFFNYHLQRLVDDGVLQKLRHRLFSPFLMHNTEHTDSVNGWISVRMGHLVPILVALGAGVVLGAAFLCLEKLMWLKRRRYAIVYPDTVLGATHCELCL